MWNRFMLYFQPEAGPANSTSPGLAAKQDTCVTVQQTEEGTEESSDEEPESVDLDSDATLMVCPTEIMDLSVYGPLQPLYITPEVKYGPKPKQMKKHAKRVKKSRSKRAKLAKNLKILKKQKSKRSLNKIIASKGKIKAAASAPEFGVGKNEKGQEQKPTGSTVPTRRKSLMNEKELEVKPSKQLHEQLVQQDKVAGNKKMPKTGTGKEARSKEALIKPQSKEEIAPKDQKRAVAPSKREGKDAGKAPQVKVVRFAKNNEKKQPE